MSNLFLFPSQIDHSESGRRITFSLLFLPHRLTIPSLVGITFSGLILVITSTRLVWSQKLTLVLLLFLELLRRFGAGTLFLLHAFVDSINGIATTIQRGLRQFALGSRQRLPVCMSQGSRTAFEALRHAVKYGPLWHMAKCFKAWTIALQNLYYLGTKGGLLFHCRGRSSSSDP